MDSFRYVSSYYNQNIYVFVIVAGLRKVHKKSQKAIEDLKRPQGGSQEVTGGSRRSQEIPGPEGPMMSMQACTSNIKT